jgi:hypothetical protein
VTVSRSLIAVLLRRPISVSLLSATLAPVMRSRSATLASVRRPLQQFNLKKKSRRSLSLSLSQNQSQS